MEDAVFTALKAGYHLIDTAAFYQTEAAVGHAIRRAQAELGIERADIFVTSKLRVSDTSYDGVRRAYGFRLYRPVSIHNPMNDVFSAWRALSELLQDGAVRAIGTSNFSRARLEDFISFNEVVPQVNQVEINVLHQQIEDVEYMAEHGIAAQAWAPFAHGKSVPQVIERWLIQRGIALIPKSTTPERIVQSANIWDFSLSDGEMELCAL